MFSSGDSKFLVIDYKSELIVLIVDDLIIVCELLLMIFSKVGYWVE